MTSRSGFTLIETLLAGLIFSLVLTTIVTSISAITMSQLRAQQRLHSTILAANNLEITYNYSLGNWSRITSLTSGLPYHPELVSGTYQISEDYAKTGPFSTAIIIEPVKRDSQGLISESGTIDPHTYKLTSRVKWETNETNTYDLITFLTEPESSTP
jgi:type II secretory pathway pseudopilin PulG